MIIIYILWCVIGVVITTYLISEDMGRKESLAVKDLLLNLLLGLAFWPVILIVASSIAAEKSDIINKFLNHELWRKNE